MFNCSRYSFHLSLDFLLTYTLSYYQKIQIWTHLSIIYFATLSMSSFLPITVFSVYLPSVTQVSSGLCTLWVSTDLSWFFTQEELNSAVNYRAVFLLYLLLSIIKCLSSAEVVTFCAPDFFCQNLCQFLTTFVRIITLYVKNFQLLGNFSLS